MHMATREPARGGEDGYCGRMRVMRARTISPKWKKKNASIPNEDARRRTPTHAPGEMSYESHDLVKIAGCTSTFSTTGTACATLKTDWRAHDARRGRTF